MTDTSRSFRLTPGKRVLFLTKDPALVRKQLAGELNLQMKDLKVEDLLDDVNTDAMTPAWVCFDFLPQLIAKNAYAGLIVDGQRLFPEGALTRDGRMAPFRPGIERIVERSPVPVVPVALNGLWGSFFSHRDGPAMAKRPRRFWSRVRITFGAPVPAADVNAERLQELVRELWSRWPDEP